MPQKRPSQPSEMDESRELISRAQTGDARAFNELFARHRAAVHRVIAGRLGRSLRGRIDPSDVVQDAQIEVLERMTEYVVPANALWIMVLANCYSAALEAASACGRFAARYRTRAVTSRRRNQGLHTASPPGFGRPVAQPAGCQPRAGESTAPRLESAGRGRSRHSRHAGV